MEDKLSNNKFPSPKAIKAAAMAMREHWLRDVVYRHPQKIEIADVAIAEVALVAAGQAQPVVAVGSEASEIVTWLRQFAPTDQAAPVDHIANRIENSWCPGGRAEVVALPPCPRCEGDGRMWPAKGAKPCPSCKGSGVGQLIPVSELISWINGRRELSKKLPQDFFVNKGFNAALDDLCDWIDEQIKEK